MFTKSVVNQAMKAIIPLPPRSLAKIGQGVKEIVAFRTSFEKERHELITNYVRWCEETRKCEQEYDTHRFEVSDRQIDRLQQLTKRELESIEGSIRRLKAESYFEAGVIGATVVATAALFAGMFFQTL
jgi:hypothetical protein